MTEIGTTTSSSWGNNGDAIDDFDPSLVFISVSAATTDPSNIDVTSVVADFAAATPVISISETLEKTSAIDRQNGWYEILENFGR